MLQIVRLGQQYINLAHVLGVALGLHQWEDDAGEHEVALAVVELDGPGLATQRFYGQTALALRAWLDERTTVIAAEAEECPEKVWTLETTKAWGEMEEEGGEDNLNAEADATAAERAADRRAGAPAWTWEGPTIPF